jgi:hypothetical protein
VEGLGSVQVAPELLHEAQAGQRGGRLFGEAGLLEEGQGLQVVLSGWSVVALAPRRQGQPVSGVRGDVPGSPFQGQGEGLFVEGRRLEVLEKHVQVAQVDE